MITEEQLLSLNKGDAVVIKLNRESNWLVGEVSCISPPYKEMGWSLIISLTGPCIHHPLCDTRTVYYLEDIASLKKID